MEHLDADPVESALPTTTPLVAGFGIAASGNAVAPTAQNVAASEAIAAQAAADAEAKAREAADKEAAEREAQLQMLLQRMQRNADFPSLKDSIRGIQKVARSESAHMRTLTEEVLGDVALSNKLLRMINTAFYSSVGAGSISSLARAVALMGFQPVGMLATSLTLFDHLPKGAAGARVREVFSRSLLAAMLANQFCPVRKLEESAYIAAMFQDLGGMLAWMHFPPEAAEIEAALAEAGSSDHAALQTASRQVLGMAYDDLAVEVARLWGWPEALQLNLRRLEPGDPERAATADEFLRVVCTAANNLAAELESVDDTPEAMEALLASFRQRYAIPLGLGEDELPAMVERAQAQWADLSLVLGFAKAQPVIKAASGARGASAGKAQDPARPTPRSLARSGPRRKPVSVALGSAVEGIARLVDGNAPMAELLQFMMAQLHEVLELQRVIVCLRDGPGGDLLGRMGVGERATQLAPLFRVPMRPPSDLFGLLCAKAADTLISDTTDPVIAQRLPAWFKRKLEAPTFLLLPLVVGGNALGMIYADRAEVRSLTVSDTELKLLKSLRDHLITAMRTRGVGG